MEVMPGYRQTEIGFLPNDWHVRRVGDLGRVVRGSSPRPAGDPRYFNGSYIPWLTVAALTTISENQTTVETTESHLTELGASHSRTLEPGTLIIANSGATLGVAKLLGFRCCANDGIAALVQHRCGHLPFIAYVINSQTQRLRQVVATGNGQPNLNTTLISDILVPFPAEAEQQAIAQALSDIDESIQSLERLIAKKRDLKQAAMQQLLTGQTRLPGFSGEWPERSFADLFVFSGGFSASREQLSHVGHCYLHYGDIHTTARTCIDLRTDADSIPRLNIALGQVAPASLLADGDVVFVDASEDVDGTSRHVVVANPEGIPFISGLHTIVAKGKDGSLDREYKRFCFQAEAIKRQFRFYAVGTKVSGVSKTNITRMSMRVPSLPEQKAIAEILSDMDAEIAALEARLTKTRDLKQGMMQELLTGRTRLV